MTQKEKLRILKKLLWKIGNSSIGYTKEAEKKFGKIISEIRYGYCYNQSNSYVGQSEKELEQLRIDSLNRLDKL